MNDLVYKVSIPYTQRDFFDYDMADVVAEIGSRVLVSFHNKIRIGIIVAVAKPENVTRKLKQIQELIDKEPLLSNDILALCEWISIYYQSPLSEVLPLSMPQRYRRGDDYQIPVQSAYNLSCTSELAHARCSAKAHRQHALINLLVDLPAPVFKQDLLLSGCSSATLKSLINIGLIKEEQQISTPKSLFTTQQTALALHTEQAAAVNTITDNLHTYKCFLLQGITGSGKTEVYLQVIEQVLARGCQVLILVPEIGLTPQLLFRFQSRFGVPIGVLHSELNERERQETWTLARECVLRLVIGTRSAVFTPMPKLGLIILDEEHDSSFKQMEGVRYSARDVALMRAYKSGIPAILGSATPSLESLHNCDLNKYLLLRLNHKALSSTPLHYIIMDIRHQNLEEGIATATLAMISDHLQQKNQVLVFINRRGFSPVLLCHACGWMADCAACDAHLTLHKRQNKLICHHCGLTQAVVNKCGACSSLELLPVGSGTQRIHSVLQAKFPQTSILRIDRDAVSKKNQLEECLQKINNGQAQLIIGTQMLAKGHHFPRLTLAVILDADNGFYNQDFRAIEHLGQRLTQVSGRAGRAEFPGQVVIQTHLPEHPLLNLLVKDGYDSFAQNLLIQRQQARLPPYYFIAVLRAEARKPELVKDFLLLIKQQMLDINVEVLGPAPAPLARKNNLHRMQLLFKAKTRNQLSSTLTGMRMFLNKSPPRGGLRWNLDVDPIDLS